MIDYLHYIMGLSSRRRIRKIPSRIFRGLNNREIDSRAWVCRILVLSNPLRSDRYRHRIFRDLNTEQGKRLK